MSIVLEHLEKRFGELLIVDDVSLEIADGELFVLLGASGSGKSTILRLIAGLLVPDGGRIKLHGRDVTALPPQARGVGFVFQNYSIFRHMNVAENVEFGLKIRRLPAAERAERREELLHLVDLAGMGGRYVTQLSGGQQQRVALARALAYQPEVLLLDEPFSALDVKIRAQLRRTLKEIQRRLGVTTILVTHDQEEAFELADRIGVMERGRLLEVGTAEGLYDHPQTAFVATFVGSGMVLVGRVEDGAARLGDTRLPLADGLSANEDGRRKPLEEGARVQVLVRPEQIALTAERTGDGVPVLGLGRVEEQVFAGAAQRVRLRLPPLRGARQLAPPIPFGEEEMVVEALSTERRAGLPAEMWVSLQGWHILEAPRPQVLVYDAGRGTDSALHLARQLSEALQGAVTVLATTDDAGQTEALKEAVKGRAAAVGLAPVSVKVAVGGATEAIQAEEAQLWYDVTVAAPDEGASIEALLDTPRQTPLLVAQGELQQVRSMMICTAAGEPGKQDVRVGGRVARRLGIAVTLLHLKAGTPRLLAERHLAAAVATLRGLGVEASSRLVAAPSAAAGILEAAREADVDLLVIGQHVPEQRLRLSEANVMRDVVSRAERPVLVVPEF